MLKDCWKVEKIGGKMAKICGSSFLNYSFHWFLIFEFNIWYLIFDYGYFCYAFLMAKNKFAINRTGFKNFFFVWAFNRAFCTYFPHCNVVLMVFAKILLNFLCFFLNRGWQKEKTCYNVKRSWVKIFFWYLEYNRDLRKEGGFQIRYYEKYHRSKFTCLRKIQLPERFSPGSKAVLSPPAKPLMKRKE